MRVFAFLLLIFLFGCKNYNSEEFNAIQDFTNEYLLTKHLPEILDLIPPPPPGVMALQKSKPNIDSLDFKVYISDALLPIAQIKKDNRNLFNKTLKSTKSDNVFKAITKSHRFTNLGYREIEKSKIHLTKPYREIFDIQSEIKENDEYVEFYFSRVCFDTDYNYGLIFVNYNVFRNGMGTGQIGIYLIHKVNSKWKIEFEE